MRLFSKSKDCQLKDFNGYQSSWMAPSNIALIKYWGKKENQIPENTSLSFTLSSSMTKTKVEFFPKRDKRFEFFFHGEKREDFYSKIETFLDHLESYCPIFKELSFTIHSENSFPHSAGIASSASSMAALSLCFMSFLKQHIDPELDFIQASSFMARLGSGSACRSIEGGFNQWGEEGSLGDQSFAVQVEEVHPLYQDLGDAIIIVDAGEKKVSSRSGHQLMKDHPYANARYKDAQKSVNELKSILKKEDWASFSELIEREALTLHGLMMSSSPSYCLMRPGSLKVIELIQKSRTEGLRMSFTLDAGPNIHLIYPKEDKEAVLKFIDEKVNPLKEVIKVIDDKMGTGAKLISEGPF